MEEAVLRSHPPCGGISEGHVRKLGNMAMNILQEIHRENMDRLRSAMGSYVLQIDGTTDSEFSMVVAVRDAASDFVLLVRRCQSESHEERPAGYERKIWLSVRNNMRSGHHFGCPIRVSWNTDTHMPYALSP